jgi:hypothetical protein
MNKSDSWVIIFLTSVILIYISVWITGFVKHKPAFYFSFLNGLTALTLIAYWVLREIRITQHFIETREIVVLSIEALIIAISVYSILSAFLNSWIKVAQYCIFGVHFLCLVLFLIFMLTFKMDRLF